MTTNSRPAVAAIVLSVAVLIASSCQLPNDFFDTSGTDMPAAPGDIARSFGYQLGFVEVGEGNVVATQNAHSLIYRSTSATGEPTLVSGTVVTPVSPWSGDGSRPIVAMAPGTQGMADTCAPSRTLSVGTFGEARQIDALVAQGFAVAVPDYEGLGTPGDHTYSVADSQAHVVLDAARAARNLGVDGLAADSPVALWGYSQGGAAVARAAEIEQDYAPDLAVEAIAAGGVVADPYRQTDWVVNGLGSGFAGAVLMSILGYAAAYPELDYWSALTANGTSLATQINELCALDAIFAAVGVELETLVDQSVLDSPAWKARIDEQLLGTVAPLVPTYVYHGANDLVVPVDQGVLLRDSWCTAGASVAYEEYPATHFETAVAAEATVVSWLSDYLTGSPATRSDC